ncbi:hypothetical protein PhaeoP18_01496 [Phaeobacter piscinae]|uniref:hypothetical protein n=1 Tax=Phaeobacter piscinae TaxID=1580596 RepID=UPI000C9B5804|nr:hypothetical protein [Phaeobacter piscinae]AUR35770.1 hypothetical protein PhaeoP18_01496 [Phaeobacter piscinae]
MGGMIGTMRGDRMLRAGERRTYSDQWPVAKDVFPINVPYDYSMGIAVWNGNLIVGGRSTQYRTINLHDGLTPSVISNTNPTRTYDDMTVLGDVLYCVSSSSAWAYNLPDFSAAAGFGRPTPYIKLICNDGENLWLYDQAGGGSQNLFKVTPSGTILETKSIGYLGPSAIAHDGENLITTVGGVTRIHDGEDVDTVVHQWTRFHSMGSPFSAAIDFASGDLLHQAGSRDNYHIVQYDGVAKV